MSGLSVTEFISLSIILVAILITLGRCSQSISVLFWLLKKIHFMHLLCCFNISTSIQDVFHDSCSFILAWMAWAHEVMLWLRNLVMASRISNLMPEYPGMRVLILTSIAALVAKRGNVLHDSMPFPKIPAFKNLLQ
ncbi:hypothetical protein Q3G72_025367 [Acer saccharum]|nr:hypothetical protein Q3G72_025367 [Acer saccharum]